MFGGVREGTPWRDFVFSVEREDVRTLRAPLLVLAGEDAYHPAAVRLSCAAITPLPPSARARSLSVAIRALTIVLSPLVYGFAAVVLPRTRRWQERFPSLLRMQS